MPMPPPAREGQPLWSVDTPALLIDLDAFEANLAAMASAARRFGLRLRPHAKTHKSPIIALKQIELGAVGVCCQKVSEAEVLAAGGVRDILVSNEVVSVSKLDRLACLARSCHVAVCIDDASTIGDLSAAAARHGVCLDVLIEIDVGGSRCGVAPGAPAVEIARAFADCGQLRFAGLHAYHGAAQHMRAPAERRAAIERAARLTKETVAALIAAGMSVPIVTGAGTGTFALEASSGVWNELQPGSYVFMDADYARNTPDPEASVPAFVQALFVYATVMSLPAPERAVVDAGLKALSTDSGLAEPWGLPGARYYRPSDEHGILELSGCATRLQLDDKVLLVPGHCDPTVNLHDWYVAVRGLHTPNARVEALWPVAARGAVF
ncbi:MAG TPA: DSD1 family PLP-dependent enzyme [Hyphomicrobiaceae bacterium]|nr:DSD1 family PLP-dependent enzyme [Hyphomicrobiaceae bacterium]